MKIAFITNFIPPYRLSFYQKLCAQPAHEWLIIHGRKDKEDGRPAQQSGLTFPNQVVGYREWRLLSFDIRWQSGVLARLRRFQPQVLILLGIPGTVSNWLALWWARRQNVPVIIWHSGWEAQSGQPRALAFKRNLLRTYLQAAQQILVYSTRGAHYLEQIGAPAEKINVCFNGIDIAPLQQKRPQVIAQGLALRTAEGVDQYPLFLYVGGMIPEKRVDLLLEAFYRLQQVESEAHLWLVGDGPERAQLQSLANELCLRNTRFWGRIIAEVDPFFRAADFFVLPGLGGLALNQALFWERPCVVSQADGTEDDLVIERQTGFRFESGDPDSLLAALQACLSLTPLERQQLGQAGRQLVLERSNTDTMIATFLETIYRLEDWSQ